MSANIRIDDSWAAEGFRRDMQPQVGHIIIVKNTTGDDWEIGYLVEIEDKKGTAEEEYFRFEGKKPTVDSANNAAVAIQQIKAGNAGRCSVYGADGRLWIKFRSGSTPIIAGTIGTKASSYIGEPGNFGFVIYGIDSDNEQVCARPFSPGPIKPLTNCWCAGLGDANNPYDGTPHHPFGAYNEKGPPPIGYWNVTVEGFLNLGEDCKGSVILLENSASSIFHASNATPPEWIYCKWMATSTDIDYTTLTWATRPITPVLLGEVFQSVSGFIPVGTQAACVGSMALNFLVFYLFGGSDPCRSIRIWLECVSAFTAGRRGATFGTSYGKVFPRAWKLSLAFP